MTRLLLVSTALLLASCAAIPTTPGGISRDDAITISRKAVKERENWKSYYNPDAPVPGRMPSFHPVPNGDGGWTVTVQQVIVEKNPFNLVFLPDTKRILTISKSGGLEKYAALK